MTDIQAAIGRKQLERLPELVARRRALAAAMPSCWAISRDLSLPLGAGMGALQLAELLRAPAGPGRPEGGHARPSRPGHRHAPRHHVLAPRGALLDGKQRHDLRQSELAQDHSILLPIYAQMTEDDLVRVADTWSSNLNWYRERSAEIISGSSGI